MSVVWRSPIRWAGSKAKLLSTLQHLWSPKDKRYFELFAGSASLFFRINPRTAHLNDSNSDLINAYQILAQHPVLLHDCLTRLPVSSSFYYDLRAAQNQSDAFDSAVRFFYLNRYCFNGIYRTNRRGQFNVPFAAYKTGGFPPLEKWRLYADRLKRAKLTSYDFSEAVRIDFRPGDFVYMDPPYAVASRRIFSEYSSDSFDDHALIRLRALMQRIHEAGAVFVVSYALAPESSMIAQGWYSTRRVAQRNIAGFSKHRRLAEEVIISNDRARLRGLP